jgi:hypothetical protein
LELRAAAISKRAGLKRQDEERREKARLATCGRWSESWGLIARFETTNGLGRSKSKKSLMKLIFVSRGYSVCAFVLRLIDPGFFHHIQGDRAQSPSYHRFGDPSRVLLVLGIEDLNLEEKAYQGGSGHQKDAV